MVWIAPLYASSGFHVEAVEPARWTSNLWSGEDKEHCRKDHWIRSKRTSFNLGTENSSVYAHWQTEHLQAVDACYRKVVHPVNARVPSANPLHPYSRKAGGDMALISTRIATEGDVYHVQHDHRASHLAVVSSDPDHDRFRNPEGHSPLSSPQ